MFLENQLAEGPTAMSPPPWPEFVKDNLRNYYAGNAEALLKRHGLKAKLMKRWYGVLFLFNVQGEPENLEPPDFGADRMMAYQPFQHGMMWWDSGNIFVVWMDDGWQMYTDTSEGSEPCCDCPPGLYLPSGGFGRLWTRRDMVESLGYALKPEDHGYGSIVYDFDARNVWIKDICDGDVFLLKNDGTWLLYNVPHDD